MKLVYFDISRGSNFGDMLNEPIFTHHLPDFFDDDDQTAFVGIGSILGLDFTKWQRKKIVFSSGFAYGTLPAIDSSYEFFCVRGRKTAEALNLDMRLAIGDGAYLVRDLPTAQRREKSIKCSVMFHWHSLEKYAWRQVAEEAGLHFIDPRDPVDVVLEQIQASDLILAEAMHAAIVADALRVPWVPIACYPKISEFKWEDFCSAIGIEYNPIRIPSLYAPTQMVTDIIRKKARFAADTKLGRGAVAAALWTMNKSNYGRTVRALAKAQDARPLLSSDSTVSTIHQRLLERLSELRSKYSFAR